MFKVLREYSIFILAIMTFLSSCQLTNTGENNKSVLNEDLRIEEKEKVSEKEALIERSDDDISEKPSLIEIEPSIVKEDPIEEPYENISSAQKIKDEKRILDFFSDLFKSDELKEKKSEIENSDKSDAIKEQVIVSNDKKIDRTLRKERTEFLVQDKPKDEKRILDFFTKFFEPDNQKIDDETVEEDLQVLNDQNYKEKINDSEKQKQKSDENIEQGNSKEDKPIKNRYKEKADFKNGAPAEKSDIRSSLKRIEIKEISEDTEIQDSINKRPLNEKLIEEVRSLRSKLYIKEN